MYKRIDDVDSGCCALVAPSALVPAAIASGDIVSLTVNEDTDFYIEVELCEHHRIKGVLIAIGPQPERQYRQWMLGDKVDLPAAWLTAIVRKATVQRARG